MSETFQFFLPTFLQGLRKVVRTEHHKKYSYYEIPVSVHIGTQCGYPIQGRTFVQHETKSASEDDQKKHPGSYV